MGWYHYQMNDNGTCDTSAPVECPDGTCSASAKPPAENKKDAATKENAVIAAPPVEDVVDEPYNATEPIYHLCQEDLWLKAVQSAGRLPYFPPTFWPDGKFTRCSCTADRLWETANHYYQDVPGRWLCLKLDPAVLAASGIVCVAQRAPETSPDDPIQCLKVYSGISVTTPGLVTAVYRMKRSEATGRFLPTAMQLDASVPVMAETVTQQEQPLPKTKQDTITAAPTKPKAKRFWLKSSR